jgi:hypothetical protein
MFRKAALALMVGLTALTSVHALENPNFPHPGSSAAVRPEMRQAILNHPRVKQELAEAARAGLSFDKITVRQQGWESTFIVHVKSTVEPRIGGGYFEVHASGHGIAGPIVTFVGNLVLLR